MIDCHCHILPGIDDGPETMDQALALCQAMVEDGVRQAYATPHIHAGRWHNTPETISRAYDQICTALRKSSIPLELKFAAEVRISDELINWVADGQIPYIGSDKASDEKLLLLEFPHGHMIPGSINLVRWLVKNGVTPIIAHPERNKELQKNIGALKEFLAAGAILQLTAASVIGEFGEGAHRAAEQIIEANWQAIIASDAHNLNGRAPRMSAAKHYVTERWGEEKVSQYFYQHQNRWWAASSLDR